MNAQHLDAASGAYMLGRALLDAGKLPQAEWAFFEGRRFAEYDYRFPAKIAAVRYEMGSYTTAIYFIERALSLLDPHSHNPTRQELYLSMARASLLCTNLKKARIAISHLISEQDRRPLEQSLLYIEAMTTISGSPATTTTRSDSSSQGLSFQPNKKTLQREVVERLPKFRPKLADEVEFIPVGSEPVRGLFSSSLVQLKQEDYSFLFVNTGDARDVFATLSDIGYTFSQNLFPSTKKFYFTLVDPKSISFARDLLMFRMLTDWVTESETGRRVTAAALAYTFASQIIPAWVYDRLKSAMRCLSDELRTDASLIMGRFCMDATTRDSIFSHYRNWQDPLQHPFTTQQILGITGQQLEGRNTATNVNPEAPPQAYGSHNIDNLCFRDLKFMLPPLPVLQENERGLLELARRFGYMPHCPTLGKILLEGYVATHWWPNYSSGVSNLAPRMNFTPQEVVGDLYWMSDPEETGTVNWCAFEYLTHFFSSVAKWTDKIRDQTMIKIIVNDAMDVMELAELHLLNNDHPSIPDRYDRIEMSYLPDFVGGPLTTFTYGVPILRHEKTSELRSFVSFNPTLWVTQDQFLTEYLLLTDRSVIANTFATALTDESSYRETEISERNSSSVVLMEQSFSWVRTSNKPMRWDQLMTRQELTKWLHMHLLKLCLPPCRVKVYRRLVYMPLNMTAFFHLINHLSRVGYPSHWLSAVLTEICTGRISSEARAPKAMLMDKSEAIHKHPRGDIFIEPFVEEFRTHFVIWNHLFPFGILQDKNPLQHMDAIREYKQYFPVPNGTLLTHVYHPVIALIFWNVSLNGEIPQADLRQVLLDDENTDPKFRGIAGHSGRVHVISTVKIASSAMTASFWFADGPIQNILSTGNRWEAWLWDTNDWTPKLGPARVDRMTLMAGEVWRLSGGR